MISTITGETSGFMLVISGPETGSKDAEKSSLLGSLIAEPAEPSRDGC